MNIYVCWKLDHGEELVDSALMADNTSEVTRISQELEQAEDTIKKWAQASGGKNLLSMATKGVVAVPADKIADLPQIRSKFKDLTGCSVAIGVGLELSEAFTALKYAIHHGGDQIALYEDGMEREMEGGGIGKEPNEELGKDENLNKMQGVAGQRPFGFDAIKKPKSNAYNNRQSGDGNMHSPADEHPTKPKPPAEAKAPEAPEAEDHHGLDGGAPVDSSDSSEGGDTQQNQEDSDNQEEQDPRQMIVEALQEIKQAAPTLEQLKQQSPETYKAVLDVVQAMLTMADGIAEDEETPGEDHPPEESSSAGEESSSNESTEESSRGD